MLLCFTLVYTLVFLAFVGWRVIARTQQGWIGMTLEDPPPSSYSDPQIRDWAVVASVYPGGPADRRGIRVDQKCYLTFNGAPVEFKSKAFKDLATRAKVGDALGVLPAWSTWNAVDNRSYPDFQPTVVTIENPLRTPGIIVDLLASLFVGFTSLVFGFYLRWKQPQDRGAVVFFVTAVLAASYSFLDGLRPLDSDFNLDPGNLRLFVVVGILWASRLPTWIALLAASRRVKKDRLRMQMFLLGTLLATLLVVMEFRLLKDVTSHQLLMEVFSKAAYWVFLMTVGLGIMYSPPKEPAGVISEPVAA